MKNQISRLLIVGGFVLCFVAGAAFHSIPGATSVTVAAAQDKRDAMADLARARYLLQEARALLASAPGEFGAIETKQSRKWTKRLEKRTKPSQHERTKTTRTILSLA